MFKKQYLIGADLGGTWIRVVLSDENGRFLERTRESVDKTNSGSVSLQIVRLARLLLHRRGFDAESIKAVGVASTGPLIMKEGALIRPTNLPFDRVELTKPIGEELNVRAYLINDCVGAALGEKMFGAAKKVENFIYVTIGTGIGGGVIANNTLLLGKDGNGHEIGHFVIDCEGRLICGCGRRGHWEAYCSGRNIPNFVRMKLKDWAENEIKGSLLFKKTGGKLSSLSSADLFSAAKEDDALSIKLVSEIGLLNAMGFATAINAYDPSLITVGGTVTLNNEELILPPIRRLVKDYAINRVPKIITTPLGDDAGLYGAVAAAATRTS